MTFGIDEIHRMIDALDRSENDFRKTAKALNAQCGKPSGNTFERFADECKGIIRKLYQVLDTKEVMRLNNGNTNRKQERNNHSSLERTS